MTTFEAAIRRSLNRRRAGLDVRFREAAVPRANTTVAARARKSLYRHGRDGSTAMARALLRLPA